MNTREKKGREVNQNECYNGVSIIDSLRFQDMKN